VKTPYFTEISLLDFFDFLQKIRIFPLEKSVIFEKFNENNDHEPLEIIAENTAKKYHFLISLITFWAKNLENVMKIVFLLINDEKNGKNDIKLAMELFLAFSYQNTKRPGQCFEIRNFSIFASFGCLLGKFYQMLYVFLFKLPYFLSFSQGLFYRNIRKNAVLFQQIPSRFAFSHCDISI